MLIFVAFWTAGVVVIVCAIVLARPRAETSEDTAGTHRRPAGCPPDPVLRLALATVGTHGLGLKPKKNTWSSELAPPRRAIAPRAAIDAG